MVLLSFTLKAFQFNVTIADLMRVCYVFFVLTDFGYGNWRQVEI